MTGPSPKPAPRTALVTGASAGLGTEFARQLAAEGHSLVLVARDRARLEDVAGRLEREYGTTAEVLPADLTDDAGLAAVVERLTDPARPVEILVNNAGIGLLGGFEENTAEDERNLLRLHCEAAMELAHAALQGMLARGSGRVVNVSSVAAFTPGGTYSAAKAWLLSFSRSANVAYRRRGVKVTAVCPGLTHTEFHQRMGMDKSVAPGWMWLDAGRVVREGLADNARGKAVSIPSRRYKVLVSGARLLPDSVVARAARR
ncbi:SDR family oxidoreductase [Pseudarthrobacter sp. J75]|uniref:SDR family NAD(P)-dependent oxidoreductase n=1 Tax=unclassified Pseudarthrobacter TaxID=2647000 RepID=UPI002E817195|nr:MULTISPECIES: SDR family oxidoreductase [unclassified Pseudarthrobacter]MEE2523583.1 SDR family oxidoreductase [Pseudarthrobacter sp. J47]MEE2530565.1 SDR family oxidoreductase [Pseudarthrobacter sp. J75]